jgi:hypothetical protein
MTLTGARSAAVVEGEHGEAVAVLNPHPVQTAAISSRIACGESP